MCLITCVMSPSSVFWLSTKLSYDLAGKHQSRTFPYFFERLLGAAAKQWLRSGTQMRRSTHINFCFKLLSILFSGRLHGHWNFSNIPEFAWLFYFRGLFKPDVIFVSEIHNSVLHAFESLRQPLAFEGHFFAQFFYFCHIILMTMLHTWEFIKTNLQFFKILEYTSNIISKP